MIKRATGRFIVILLWVLSFSPAISTSSVNADLPALIHTEANLKVAIIGDQGLGTNAQAVLNLIASEAADLVLHAGDFDYTNNPDAWDDQITAILGADFPYLLTAGNHDMNRWADYQQKFQRRVDLNPELICSGDLGMKSECTFRGLKFILSGVGLTGTYHADYIRSELQPQEHLWNICAWHLNMNLMQVGAKTDDTGWDVYEACRENGAIIATAHEHSYARTYLLESIQSQVVASTSDTLILERGRTFVIQSGLAGHSIRVQQRFDHWWAAVYTATQNATFGALFCEFNLDGFPDRAHCYFKAINGAVVDEFDVLSALASGTTFVDVPSGHPAFSDIQYLYDNGYVAGCDSEEPRYCVENSFLRSESSVFMLRGKFGPEYVPVNSLPQFFADVPFPEWSYNWVNSLYMYGFTSGCELDPLRYCPYSAMTRAEGAVFFLRLLLGSDYSPPSASGFIADAPVGTWYTNWVEEAYSRGILAACNTGPLVVVCPEDELMRGTAASMMVKVKTDP